MNDAKRVRQRLEDIRAMMAHRSPIDYFILRGVNVYYDDRYDGTGYTDGKSIWLGREWIEQEDVQCLVTLVHEIGHIKLLHPFRMQHEEDLARLKVIQFAMDLVVNFHIKQLGLRPKIDPNNYFNDDVLMKSSAEELADRLVNEGKVQLVGIQLEVGMDCFNKDGQSTSCPLVQKGEKDIETSDDVKDLVKQSLLAAKVAGQKMSAADKILLDMLLRSKVNWKFLLRRALHNYVAKNCVSKWTRLNRKLRDFPGKEMISRPKAWCFVDVSGSIGEREFNQFMSEVLRVLDFVEEVRLVTWNVGVCEDRTVKKKSDVLVQWEKGGGTQFEPVWREYKGKMKRNDVMIVLTDGYWFDDDGFVVKGGPNNKILVTTGVERGVFNHVIKIDE